MRTQLLVAVALVVSMSTAHPEENSTGAVPKVREVHPPTVTDKAGKTPKIHGAATTRTSPEKLKSRKSSSGRDGESAVAKAWREADI